MTGTDVPEVVYHYTSGFGLEKILENHELWATEANMLNDPLEGRFFEQNQSEIFAYLAQMEYLLDEDDGASRFTWIVDRKPRIFCLSASRSADNVAMWRDYADLGKGYAIGLNTDSFLGAYSKKEYRQPRVRSDGKVAFQKHGKDIDLKGWQLVSYDTQAAMERLKCELKSICDRPEPTEWPKDDWDEYCAYRQEWDSEIFSDLVDAVIATNSLIKARGWEYEQEVRFVVNEKVLNSNTVATNWRNSAYGIARYLRLGCTETAGNGLIIDDDQSKKPLPIHEIVVGPNASPVTIENLEGWLAEFGYKDVRVRQSESRFR